MKEIIKKLISDSIDAKKQLLQPEHIDTIEKIAKKMIAALSVGKKLVVCGNGGSAADAEHFVGELVGRLHFDRKPLPAIALTSNAPVITALSNDYGYDELFARQVEAYVHNGDIVVGISTSGNSPNVIKALKKGKDLGAWTVALCGEGGEMKKIADITLSVPSRLNVRIQECHTLAVHIICHLIEEQIFGKN